MKKLIVLVSVTISFIFAQTGTAQQFDYPAYPKMDLTYTKLEATLEIDEQSQIRGDVLYSVQFNLEFLIQSRLTQSEWLWKMCW